MAGWAGAAGLRGARRTQRHTAPRILRPTPAAHRPRPSPPSTPSPNPPSIYEAVGRGSGSTVYKGRRKRTIQYVAVKSVAKARRPRVLAEVRTMHALDHPNVLKFYAW